MANAGPGLKGFMRAFNLFSKANGQGRVGRFCRHGAGDGHADDAGFWLGRLGLHAVNLPGAQGFGKGGAGAKLFACIAGLRLRARAARCRKI